MERLAIFRKNGAALWASTDAEGRRCYFVSSSAEREPTTANPLYSIAAAVRQALELRSAHND